MPGKILFCATVDYHFKAFHIPYLKWFKEQGWEVHVAASGNTAFPYVDRKYNIPIQRSPFKRKNIEAFKELKGVMDENHYRIIHCHTPMGGVLARLAARQTRQRGTKVIYTAHGFHFCKGAPLFNWIIYYPIERGLSRYTDCLITINNEDYNLAINHKFKAKKIEHVQGVGVDSQHYKPINETEKQERRKSYGYHPDDFLLFYGAELNKNKNQQLLLHVLSSLKEEVPRAKLLLAGNGDLLDQYKELAVSLGIEDYVHFLGFRKDIKGLLSICDVAVASSLREGLPVNIMEAMALGLPIVATDNRGHRELIKNDKNGWIVSCNDIRGFSEKVKILATDEELKKKMGMNGHTLIESTYSTHQILEQKSKVYTELMEK